HITAIAPSGLRPDNVGVSAEVVFKVSSANVVTSQIIRGQFLRGTGDECSISISTSNGQSWREIWKAHETETLANIPLVRQVSGAYEVLVKVRMIAQTEPASLVLKSLHIQTTTQLNSKTLPKLNIGRNMVYVGAGEQSESVVLWPE